MLSTQHSQIAHSAELATAQKNCDLVQAESLLQDEEPFRFLEGRQILALDVLDQRYLQRLFVIGIEFDGRAATPPLMLREGDVPGLFSRTRDLGTQIDPAETARTNVASENGETR